MAIAFTYSNIRIETVRNIYETHTLITRASSKAKDHFVVSLKSIYTK